MTYVYDEERGLAVPKWTTATPDWEQRIIEGRSLIPCGPLFQETHDAYMPLFNAMPIADIRGQPRMGDVARPWVTDFAGVFFGSLCMQTHKRLITEFFMLISKKNTKSTVAAFIMLTILVKNARYGAEYSIIAPTKRVALNAFKPIMQIIKNVPELEAMLHVQEHYRKITHRVTETVLEVVAADTEAVGGSKSAGVLIDELWIFGSRSRAAGVLAEAVGGLASQPDGFVINLTTQSEASPSGVFESKLKYARAVRDGEIINPAFLPILYEHPKSIIESNQHLEPKNFYMTNPNLGASVSQSFLESGLQQAIDEGDENKAIFMAKHLNVQIGLTLRGESWVAARFWEKQQLESTESDLGAILSKCEVVAVGVDGGGLDDLFSLSVIGRVKGGREWLHWNHCWVHKSVLDLRKADAPKMQDLQKDGDLTICEEVGQEVEEASVMIMAVKKSGLMYKVGVDPSRIAAFLDSLSDAGLDEDDVIGISQGWRLYGAMTIVERKLADGSFLHGGQRIMEWALSNAKTEPRGNALLVTKQASGRGKIDPVMSMLNAAQLMGENPEPSKNLDESIFAWDFNEAI